MALKVKGVLLPPLDSTCGAALSHTPPSRANPRPEPHWHHAQRARARLPAAFMMAIRHIQTLKTLKVLVTLKPIWVWDSRSPCAPGHKLSWTYEPRGPSVPVSCALRASRPDHHWQVHITGFWVFNRYGISRSALHCSLSQAVSTGLLTKRTFSEPLTRRGCLVSLDGNARS